MSTNVDSLFHLAQPSCPAWSSAAGAASSRSARRSFIPHAALLLTRRARSGIGFVRALATELATRRDGQLDRASLTRTRGLAGPQASSAGSSSPRAAGDQAHQEPADSSGGVVLRLRRRRLHHRPDAPGRRRPHARVTVLARLRSTRGSDEPGGGRQMQLPTEHSTAGDRVSGRDGTRRCTRRSVRWPTPRACSPRRGAARDTCADPGRRDRQAQPLEQLTAPTYEQTPVGAVPRRRQLHAVAQARLTIDADDLVLSRIGFATRRLPPTPVRVAQGRGRDPGAGAFQSACLRRSRR